MASYQEISFPDGWFNTYPQTQPNPTQHVPGKFRKVRKRVQKEDLLGNKLWKADGTPQWTSILVDKPEPPPVDPLQQVILGLLSLAISIGRGNSSKQKQAKQASKQATKTLFFLKQAKVRKAKLATQHVPKTQLEVLQELLLNINVPSVMEIMET